jgi:hypothetical protein
MGRDQGQPGDAGQFEWVNVWAATSGAAADAVPGTAPEPLGHKPEPAAVAPQQTAVTTGTGRFVAVKSTASRAEADTKSKPGPQIVVPLPGASPSVAAPLPTDQLMRDIVEIERARDALATGPLVRRLRTFMVVPARTADSVPLVIGGVLALVLLTMFGGAAAFTKLGR